MCAGCAGRRVAIAAAARLVVRSVTAALTGRDLNKAVHDRMAHQPRPPAKRP